MPFATVGELLDYLTCLPKDTPIEGQYGQYVTLRLYVDEDNTTTAVFCDDTDDTDTVN
jgi:hypothetical protein